MKSPANHRLRFNVTLKYLVQVLSCLPQHLEFSRELLRSTSQQDERVSCWISPGVCIASLLWFKMIDSTFHIFCSAIATKQHRPWQSPFWSHERLRTPEYASKRTHTLAFFTFDLLFCPIGRNALAMHTLEGGTCSHSRARNGARQRRFRQCRIMVSLEF